MRYDVVIVGAGAAGLMCAQVAGHRGKRVLVVEHSDRLGNKILISGGGRCNFTNTGATPVNYVTSGSPHFLKSAMARYTPRHFLSMVERHGIAWHEKKLGQLFCDHSSKEIVRMLLDECRDAGVEIWFPARVNRVDRRAGMPAQQAWGLDTTRGEVETGSLVVATGGLSFPNLGVSPWGYSIAEQFGVPLVPVRPGLVPLTWSDAERDQWKDLSGISLDVESSSSRNGTPVFRENLLFTHRGVSGPAVLQVSSHRLISDSVRFHLMPGEKVSEWIAIQRSANRDLKPALRKLWPERFVDTWLRRHGPARPLAQLGKSELVSLEKNLGAWEPGLAGDEGYPKAEVTVGGVSTGALSSQTMECRLMPGLYFIGEVVDVTGWLGGYNFQWAWASGNACGSAAGGAT